MLGDEFFVFVFVFLDLEFKHMFSDFLMIFLKTGSFLSPLLALPPYIAFILLPHHSKTFRGSFSITIGKEKLSLDPLRVPGKVRRLK